MLSVTGIYDGNSVVFTEPVTHHKKCKVIITFLEDADMQEEDMSLRNFGMQNHAFDFWNNPAEDVYEDYASQK